jgi:hypothetical protein
MVISTPKPFLIRGITLPVISAMNMENQLGKPTATIAITVK